MDEFRSWKQAFDATPPTRSLAPEVLQKVHERAATTRDSAAIGVGGERTDLCTSLYLAELAYAAGDFDRGIGIAERCYASSPNDLRTQDALFRGRFYKANGLTGEVGKELAGKTCFVPFNSYEILPRGDVHLCCAVWLRTSVGNAFTEADPDRIFNSEKAEDIRRTIHDGSYAYCGKIACPYIANNQLLDAGAVGVPFAEVGNKATKLSRPPGSINLSYDRTCNLSCPSCRSEHYAAVGAERERMLEITHGHVLPLLKTAQTVFITGSGDPFASKSFRRVLETLNPADYPGLKIGLMTNGLLLTPEEWRKFQHLHGMISQINISVDAATPETYRVVRRGGEFGLLRENLRFVGQLRQTGAIGRYLLAFVVQALNYREMPSFIDLARQVGADRVHFQMISDWGVLGTQAFARAAVHLPSHPEHKGFLAVLEQVNATRATSGDLILSDFG